MLFHSGNVTCPMQLYFKQHCFDRVILAVGSFEDFDVQEKDCPIDVEGGTEVELMESFEEMDVAAI